VINWKDCHLDKDLLFKGNKLYGPDTCLFVEERVNLFLIDENLKPSGFLKGASMVKKSGRFRSYCNNPFLQKNEHLGVFATELEAHLAWKAKKHEHACRLADLQDDPRVAEALRQRYF
jgi:hypothetical protein